jgi:hypothetical protein
MSKQTLSTAEILAVGRAYDARLFSEQGFKGVEINPLSKISLGAPALAVADLLIDAATTDELPDAETLVYAAATQGTAPQDKSGSPAAVEITTATGATATVIPLDLPRNVVATAAKSGTTVAMTVLVSGYDQYGYAMSELLDLPATSTTITATGKKAFKWIASMAVTSAGDATGAGLTLDVGPGSLIGLPFALAAKSDALGVYFDDAAANTPVLAKAVTTSPATNVTGDVRGTVGSSDTFDGAKLLEVWMRVADYSTRTGLLGVAQA